MPLFRKQLELDFTTTNALSVSPAGRDGRASASEGNVAASLRLPRRSSAKEGRGASDALTRTEHGDTAPWLQRKSAIATDAPALQFSGRDATLEIKARKLLIANGAAQIAGEVRVEWNPRMRTAAGRADYREKLISLNPQLWKLDGFKPSSLTSADGAIIYDEIDRTFRHELAHFLAQFRTGRRRILPHGAEWRAACADLGISDEKRCHNLPFPFIERTRRFLYRCPHCKRDFPRVRKIRRSIACLACCRKYSGGEFDPRFRLKLASL